ncbi:uncharacterized protein [Arachis hypogaea]|uniref:Uncharacterized protein n=2 Tax=Arachis TaxID=3817 RepID=A0A445D6F5_ARAHY|nr:uncharacterized protein DS421_5g149810 [Arachis hypogaea]RYR58847.1 hypothetical protein Ahy_A05g024712 [Arachis hypogaea]
MSLFGSCSFSRLRPQSESVQLHPEREKGKGKGKVKNESVNESTTMGGASHAMKRIPRIKFPQRHPKSSGSASAAQGSSQTGDAGLAFFSGSNALAPAAGKASLQPKRTPVSKEEIEAILLGGCF